MKRPKFLNDAIKRGRIKLIDGSEVVMFSYIEKSERNLLGARILMEQDLPEEGVSPAYYSMYYMALALFFRIGLKCENHTATIVILKEVFGLETDDLSKAKDERIEMQYHVDHDIAKEDVLRIIRIAEDFNARLRDFIDRLDQDRIQEYRRKASRFLGISAK